MYAFYRHRRDSGRELVMRDGALFPNHLRRDDWYLYGVHGTVNGRTESDIEILGFCDRIGGSTFGHRVAARPYQSVLRRVSP